MDAAPGRHGQPVRAGASHPSRSQYTSIAFTERLAAAGTAASVDSVGDVYDSALAESVIGLYKTELIKPAGPWRTCERRAGRTELRRLVQRPAPLRGLRRHSARRTRAAPPPSEHRHPRRCCGSRRYSRRRPRPGRLLYARGSGQLLRRGLGFGAAAVAGLVLHRGQGAGVSLSKPSRRGRWSQWPHQGGRAVRGGGWSSSAGDRRAASTA